MWLRCALSKVFTRALDSGALEYSSFLVLVWIMQGLGRSFLLCRPASSPTGEGRLPTRYGETTFLFCKTGCLVQVPRRVCIVPCRENTEVAPMTLRRETPRRRREGLGLGDRENEEGARDTEELGRNYLKIDFSSFLQDWFEPGPVPVPSCACIALPYIHPGGISINPSIGGQFA